MEVLKQIVIIANQKTLDKLKIKKYQVGSLIVVTSEDDFNYYDKEKYAISKKVATETYAKFLRVTATKEQLKALDIYPTYKQGDHFCLYKELDLGYLDFGGIIMPKEYTCPIDALYIKSEYSKDYDPFAAIDLTSPSAKIETIKINQNNNMKDNIQAHKEKMDFLHDLYVRKNKDYGNSFDLSLNEHGIIASVVRLEDKFNRFKKLTKSEQLVKDESIADTLLDMANYAIMTAMWLENQKQQ